MNLLKNDKLSYKRKENQFNLIELNTIVKDSLCFIDERQTGYEDPRWIEKSNSIKARDNYTCQLCHAFNPMQEGGIFIRQGEYYTLHYYDSEKSKYIIGVQNYDISINIDFMYGFYLAMPRFNVHHKIYYRNRKLWDYQDDCLVTLCEYCHHFIHSLNDVGIPIVEERKDGNTILVGKTQPKSYVLNHTDLGTFKPFAIVKENRWGDGLADQDLADFRRAKSENKKWYDHCQTVNLNEILRIRTIKSYDPQCNKYTHEEIERVVKFIIYDFIGSILCLSKIEQ
ncbi:MAG: hypothetical protein IJ892_14260 [Prevotella sp.]|nr:hypothetical protein [Prevotella sp.]